tara:strand:+ start:225 stop:677 length:453 start_codon:yes stop_codon:yes gene_type:complete
MKLKEILSISGRQGLYKLKTKTRGGVIATSLVDGKRVITTINQKISFLSEIQVYCIGNEINLSKVFEKMLLFESGKISRVVPKANSLDLETYFLKIIDDYDKERVYPSDIKKIIQWYNILVTQKIIKFDKEIIKRPETHKKDNSTQTKKQ